MRPSRIVDEFRRLDPAAQIRLLHQLWEELSRDPEAVELTDEQRALLDERLEALEQGRTELHDWEEVRARLTEQR
jgi:putative addiction module component (TIGR02574 family)